jgi:hypothetical protein
VFVKENNDKNIGKPETWLILPVVICLFRGLSHASLRVNGLK